MKLSLKLALYITVFALLSSGVVSLMSYKDIESRVETRATESIESLVNTIYSMASTAAYVKDRGLAEEVVSGLEQNSEIQCVELFIDELPTLNHKECGGELAMDRALSSPWHEQETVGNIRIFKSKQYVEELVSEQFTNEVSSILIMVLAISASIYVLIHVIVARPIVRVSKQLQDTNFDEDVELLNEGGREDEVGSISRVINLMIANAQKQIISEKMLARKTQELTSHFRLIFQLSKNNLAVTDEQLRLKSYNATFEEMVKHAEPNAELNDSSDWLDCVTNEPDELRQLVANTDMFDSPITIEMESSSETNPGHAHFYTLTFVKSISEDEKITILFFIYDMTEHRNRLAKTEYEASHDNLTKLLNRRAATKKIRHALSSKESTETVAIMFIDLDGFKKINDDMGHDTGDFVLRSVGKRLNAVTRKSDVVCRWGGDEFLIALNDISLSQATVSANKVLASLVEPIRLPDGGSCQIGASIGITLSTEDICDFQTLYDHADKAMYRVKKSGKNAVLVHSL